MNQRNYQKKKQQKRKQKEKERKKAAKHLPAPQSFVRTTQDKITFGEDNPIVSLIRRDKAVTFEIDISKLSLPTKKYVADSFVFQKFLGYTDLYFGAKNPGLRDGGLLNIVIVRMPNAVVRDLLIYDHESFHKHLIKTTPITKEHEEQFGLELETQFPSDQNQFAFFTANFSYAARGMGDSELMFFNISPSYLHHLSTGGPSILDENTKGVEPKLMIELPQDLLAYFYKSITDIKEEYGERLQPRR